MKIIKAAKRVYLEKPQVGSTHYGYVGNFSGNFTVEAVGDVTKDIAGKEYYELLLTRQESSGDIADDTQPV